MTKKTRNRIKELERRLSTLECMLESETQFYTWIYESEAFPDHVKLASVKWVVELILQRLGVNLVRTPGVPPQVILKEVKKDGTKRTINKNA
jgi:hypothetical protein